MHNEAFRILGLDYVYLCFDVKEDRLEEAVKGLRACGIRGFNLTMPDKNRMAELADELSPAAEIIGAVNTVVNDQGRLIGHNTDGVGFLRSVQDAGLSIAGQNLTILGAGEPPPPSAPRPPWTGRQRSAFLPVPRAAFIREPLNWWKISIGIPAAGQNSGIRRTSRL